MISAIIAVVGTLLGSLITAHIQRRAAATERRATQDQDIRAARRAAVTALVSAVADHRRAMWVREDARLTGADPEAVANLREASHRTRSAITAPLTTVAILAPDLADAAETATQATYALRGASDPDTLSALRERAVQAERNLIATASLRLV